MGEASRKEKIEALLAAEPEDIFLRYSLAMELRKEGDSANSLARFRELMSAAPPHIPSFFMASKLLVQLREVEQARCVLRAGIEHARTQGDHHAAAEMSELLTTLGGEGQ